MKLRLNLVLAILALIFIASCNQKPKELKFSKFEINNIKYPIPCDSLRSCSFNASIPIFESGNQQLIDSMNAYIAQSFFEKEIHLSDMKQFVKTESDSFHQVYMRNFADFNQADFPFRYEYNLKLEVAFYNDKYITLKNFIYEYSGGNHGNYGTWYQVFDANNGKKIAINELMGDTVKLQQMAKQEFYKMKNLDTTQLINEQGFWFEKNKFSLNNNFGLLQDTLIFTYNPYEITSYAEGQIDLKIALGTK